MIKNTIKRSDIELTKDDFISDQMVRWCPGCGAHSILYSLANTLQKTGYHKENITLISGIGCSSRLPYYVNSYGFHGIHGRPAAIATGVKIANPGLSVWLVSGDGDSLAIGGNHFIHCIRRNVDINYLLFNNQIYGLTKGQFSPTSPVGSVTKTSPYGTIENPFNIGELVIGAQGTFFARVLDTNPKLMTEVMLEAARHDGTSVIEIMQNCVIYNDKWYAQFASKETRDDNQLILKPGEKMIFGSNKNKGLALHDSKLKVVEIGKDASLDDVLTHNPYEPNHGLQFMLAEMMPPAFPVAFGVIRMISKPTYDDLMEDSIRQAKRSSDIKCVDDLLNSGDVFEI
jgi:2-oxoglutarate/2-oxoacid ferredoxin oxidoreductase subunit beta